MLRVLDQCSTDPPEAGCSASNEESEPVVPNLKIQQPRMCHKDKSHFHVGLQLSITPEYLYIYVGNYNSSLMSNENVMWIRTINQFWDSRRVQIQMFES